MHGIGRMKMVRFKDVLAMPAKRWMASIRSMQAANPAGSTILSEWISKEPRGSLARRGDGGWHAFVKRVIQGLIEAEEYAITQATVQ